MRIPEGVQVVFLSSAVAAAIASATEPEQWPPVGNEIPLYGDLGNLTFPVKATPAAQRYVDQGFRLVAAFDFGRAVLSFRAAQKLDPACAMCIWGEGFALGPNLNSFDEPKLVASVPLAHARALDAKRCINSHGGSARETAMINALLQRYSQSTEEYLLTEQDKTQTFAQTMAKVYEMFGPDANLAALAADAWMNTHPWAYWAEQDLIPEASKAMALLREGLKLRPLNAFCVHLFIHITEASPDAKLLQEARPFAEALPGMLPGAPHTVHMSFHTLMHTGNYHISDVDNARASSMPRQIYPMHNLDTLAWVCRMEGRRKCAVDAASKLAHLATVRLTGGGAFFETGFPASRFISQLLLTFVAFGMWDDILETEPPLSCSEAFSCGIWHFSRGAARAAHHNTSAAHAELAALQEQRRKVEKASSQIPRWAWKNFAGTKDWGVYPAGSILQLAELELKAFHARARRNQADEAAAWKAAYYHELALPYDEPPAWYLPVGERYGDALQRIGHGIQAAATFNATLHRFPHDGRALLGMLQLCEARAASHPSNCEDLRRRFNHAWRNADVQAQTASISLSTTRKLPSRFLGLNTAATMAALALLVSAATGCRQLTRTRAGRCRSCEVASSCGCASCLGPSYTQMPADSGDDEACMAQPA